MLVTTTGDIDVSRVDPEEVLVNVQNVEAYGIEETWLSGADHGKEVNLVTRNV